MQFEICIEVEIPLTQYTLIKMVKKQQSNPTPPTSNIAQGSTIHHLPHPSLKSNSKAVKQFLWTCLKNNIICMKSQTILREYINKVSGQANIESEIDEMLNKKQLYEKTKMIFKGPSLKEKYGRLVYDQRKDHKKQEKQQGIQLQENSQEKQRVQQLGDEENHYLAKVKKVFQRYRVSSMFRDNLVKFLKRDKLETLIQKGYLKQRKSKQCKQKLIISLSS